jgi:hypothetical protein
MEILMSSRHIRKYGVSSTIAVTLLITYAAGACAKQKTLTFRTDDTDYTVSFDSARIPEPEMRNLIILSPLVTNYAGIPGMENFWAVGATTGTVHEKALVPLPLELCLKNKPVYTNCDQNEIGSENFLHNASVNLQKSKEGLAWLQGLEHPKELKPVVNFLESKLASALAAEEKKFKYYSTWDESSLTDTHDEVYTQELCPDVLKSLQAAHTKKEKYAIVRTQWTNCAAQATSRRLGQYPTDTWNKFLQDYEIKETYTEKVPD